jgi:hypothetical protein
MRVDIAADDDFVSMRLAVVAISGVALISWKPIEDIILLGNFVSNGRRTTVLYPW